MRGPSLLIAALLFGAAHASDVSGALPPSVRAPVIAALGLSDASIAVVFPTEESAQLVVLSAAAIAVQSARFDFFPNANYGAMWIDAIEGRGTAGFVVKIRTRQTCGAGVYDYRFARRGGVWVVSGLDRAESKCSDAGILPAWHKSINFLGGRIRFTQYVDGQPQKVVSQTKAFPSFPLVDFKAIDARYEP